MTIDIVIHGLANVKTRYAHNNKEILRQIGELDGREIDGVESLNMRVKRICKNNRRKDKYVLKFWWSPEVEAAYKEKEEARTLFNAQSSLENLLNCKKK